MATVNASRVRGFELSRKNFAIRHTIAPIHFAHFVRPNCALSCKPITLTSYKFYSRIHEEALKGSSRGQRVSCLSEDSHETYSDTEHSVSEHAKQEASIDLKIPRRSLLVTFTCNVCSVRSQRLINRIAYERGLVYVQCSGCSKYHKLVDNLGLVIEYNLQEEEIDVDTNAEQV